MPKVRQVLEVHIRPAELREHPLHHNQGRVAFDRSLGCHSSVVAPILGGERVDAPVLILDCMDQLVYENRLYRFRRLIVDQEKRRGVGLVESNDLLFVDR